MSVGLRLLSLVPPTCASQTLLMMPTFIFGCSAFDPGQREQIRKQLNIIGRYTGLKNGIAVLRILEEVWRLMDERRGASWDWEGVAARLGVGVLVT